MTESTTRFGAVTRRAFLGGLSIAAIAAAAGCGTSTSSSTSAPATSGSAASPSASASASSTASASTSGSSKQIPASAKATVSWTFAANSGGMSRNPYMAVWIEDSAGTFVKTLALYHRANGDNWLNELNTWYAASGGTTITTSGTVPAGSFTAAWDGSTAAGSRAAQGTYYVCVESAVEHGSESLVRQQVRFGSAAAKTTLTPSGEITNAAVSYAV